MKILKVNAIESLVPGAECTVVNNKDIVWISKDKTQPSDSAIDAEVTRLQAIEDYQGPRRDAYPSLADQLDMQYWDKKNGTTTWVDAIAKVKSDNPKP